MKILRSLVVAASAFAPGAYAGLPPAALKNVVVEVPAHAQLPLSLPFIDETGASWTLGKAFAGRPSILIFADYTCRTLCGPILDLALAGLEKCALKPGSDYRLVVVGLDPKDGLAAARAMRSSHLGTATPIAAATTILTSEAGSIVALTEAAGYHYAYDPANDQFAHPAAAYVIAPGGRIARVLSPFGLDGSDLRLALVDAAEGHIGTFVDRLRLLCYGFDPQQGVYTSAIETWLAAVAFATVLAITGWLFFLIKASRQEMR